MFHEDKSLNSGRSEDYFREFYEHSPFAYQSLDEGGKIIFVNKRWLDVLGFDSRDEIVGRWFGEFLADPYKEKFSESFEKFKAKGRVENIEFRMKRKDGSLIDVSYNGNVLYSKDGSFIRTNCVFWVIDEEKRLQKELDEKNGLLDSIMNNLPGFSYRCLNDFRWTMKYLSSGCEKLTGYSREDILENSKISYSELIIDEDRQKVWLQIQEALKAKRSFECKYRIKTRKGMTKWVWEQGHGIYSEKDEVQMIEGFITDITDSKEYEERLKKNEATLETIMKTAPVGLGIIKNRVNQKVNKTFCRMLGYYSSELEGKDALILYPSKKEYDFVGKEKYAQIEKTGSGSVETQMVTKDGKIIDVLLSSSAIDPDDLSKGSIFSATDITQKNEAEKKIRESEAKFQAIFNQANDTIFLMDGYRFFDANQKVEEMYGFSKDEFIGKFPWDISPEKQPDGQSSRDKAKNLIDKAYKSPQLFNWVHKTTDGKLWYAEINLSPIFLKGKDYLIAIVRGVTEKTKIEQELKESYERLDKVVNGTKDFIFSFDDEGRVTEWNDAIARFLGFSKNELMFKNAFSEEFPEELSQLSSKIKNMLDKKQAGVFEVELKDKDGNNKILLFDSSFVKKDRMISIVSIGRDVSKERNIAQKLVLGKSYLSDRFNLDNVVDVVNKFIGRKYDQLIISRKSYADIVTSFPDVKNVIHLSTEQPIEHKPDAVEISFAGDVDVLRKRIFDFLENRRDHEKPGIIFMDDAIYISNKSGFSNLMGLLYDLDDQVRNKNIILILNIKEDSFTEQQISQLKQELDVFPAQREEDIYLDPKKVDVLKFIQNKISFHTNVQFTDISSRFNLSRMTTKKWIDELQELGLVYIKKEGRSKYIYLTDSGDNLISQG